VVNDNRFWQLRELVDATGVSAPVLRRWAAEGVFEMKGTDRKLADEHEYQKLVAFIASECLPRIRDWLGFCRSGWGYGKVVALYPDDIPRPWPSMLQWLRANSVCAIVCNGCVYAWPETPQSELPDLPRRSIEDLGLAQLDPWSESPTPGNALFGVRPTLGRRLRCLAAAILPPGLLGSPRRCSDKASEVRQGSLHTGH
jgi:hypothetical protein